MGKNKKESRTLTGFVWEDGRADGAGPHSQGRGDVSRLGVSRQVFAEAPLVDVMLAAHRTGVGRSPTLDAARRGYEAGPAGSGHERGGRRSGARIRDAQTAQRRQRLVVERRAAAAAAAHGLVVGLRVVMRRRLLGIDEHLLIIACAKVSGGVVVIVVMVVEVLLLLHERWQDAAAVLLLLLLDHPAHHGSQRGRRGAAAAAQHLLLDVVIHRRDGSRRSFALRTKFWGKRTKLSCKSISR